VKQPARSPLLRELAYVLLLVCDLWCIIRAMLYGDL
jgi:hypothetical protein